MGAGHEALGDNGVSFPSELDPSGGEAVRIFDISVKRRKVGDVVGKDKRFDLLSRSQRRSVARVVIAVRIGLIHLANLTVSDVEGAFFGGLIFAGGEDQLGACRSEEHTSELQSLMRISYAVFCLKKKKKIHNIRR